MRTLAPTEAFDRKLIRFVKRHPELAEKVQEILRLLENDVRYPSLKTHKLHGSMSDSYGCNINHQYRVVFSYNENFVYLESIGSHDDVY